MGSEMCIRDRRWDEVGHGRVRVQSLKHDEFNDKLQPHRLGQRPSIFLDLLIFCQSLSSDEGSSKPFLPASPPRGRIMC